MLKDFRPNWVHYLAMLSLKSLILTTTLCKSLSTLKPNYDLPPYIARTLNLSWILQGKNFFSI